MEAYQKGSDTAFERFKEVTQKIISVPKETLEKREREWKKTRRKHRVQKVDK